MTAPELLPPWLQLPEIPRFSIGWRMGYGEGYLVEFGEWWDTLAPAAQYDYQQRYPEPPDWQGWYNDEIPDEEEDNDEGTPFDTE